MGLGSPSSPIPATPPPVHVPARLSQKMLLNISESLNRGAPAGSVACKRLLFLLLEKPAGAANPLLVMEVAVVMLFMTVLL